MSTLVASCRKVVVVAIGAVEFVVGCCKWLVNQRSLTVGAFEAFLMPMCIFVRQIFGVRSNDSLAFLTRVSKEVLVAFDAVRMFIAENVPVTGEIEVTMEARKVTAVPILVHCFCVFSREYQLITCCTPWSDRFRVVSLTVDGVVFVTVAQINQQFPTGFAYETSCVPAKFVARLWGKYGHLVGFNFTFTLVAYRVLLHRVFDDANVHRLSIPHITEVVESLLLTRALQMATVLLGQVLLRQLDDQLLVSVFLSIGTDFWNLVIV
jgi:hypothetical protein